MDIQQLPTIVALLGRLEREFPHDIVDHSVSTAGVARILAAAHGVDPDRAEIAGLLHDVADHLSDAQLLERAEKYQIPVTVTEARMPKLLHAQVGAEILRRDWSIDDDEILDAVRDHITGGVRMSPLAKVLFVADKLEPHRDQNYGGLDPLRDIAMKNLDEAIMRLYAWRISKLVANSQPISQNLVASRNRLIDQTLASYR